MILSSFKTPADILHIPLKILPSKIYLKNYADLMGKYPFLRAYMNSIIISVIVTLIVVFTSTVAGYVLGKKNFKGRDTIFLLILSVLIIPFFITIIPNYDLMYFLGLLNTYWAVIIPTCISPFGIFLMRQFILTIPDELIYAAKIDGASETSIIFNIIFPLSKPAWLVLSVITFIGSWNNFLWPLLVLQRKEMYTVPLLLNYLGTAAGDPRYFGILMAGNTLGTLPTLIIATIAFKKIVEGIKFTGVKM